MSYFNDDQVAAKITKLFAEITPIDTSPKLTELSNPSSSWNASPWYFNGDA